MSKSGASNSILNVIGVAIILGVATFLLAPLITEIRDIDIIVTRDTMPPDGRAQATISILYYNALGFEVDGTQRSAEFLIVEGQSSASLESIEPSSAVVRAGLTTGLVRVRIMIDGFALPHEVQLRIEPQLT